MDIPRHRGPCGFEGFVRDLLQEALGTRFRLMKSGPQGGIDALNEPHGNALSIGFEGKRYSSSTRLSLDGLKYTAEFAIERIYTFRTYQPVKTTGRQPIQHSPGM